MLPKLLILSCLCAHLICAAQVRVKKDKPFEKRTEIHVYLDPVEVYENSDKESGSVRSKREDDDDVRLQAGIGSYDRPRYQQIVVPYRGRQRGRGNSKSSLLGRLMSKMKGLLTKGTRSTRGHRYAPSVPVYGVSNDDYRYRGEGDEETGDDNDDDDAGYTYHQPSNLYGYEIAYDYGDEGRNSKGGLFSGIKNALSKLNPVNMLSQDSYEYGSDDSYEYYSPRYYSNYGSERPSYTKPLVSVINQKQRLLNQAIDAKQNAINSFIDLKKDAVEGLGKGGQQTYGPAYYTYDGDDSDDHSQRGYSQAAKLGSNDISGYYGRGGDGGSYGITRAKAVVVEDYDGGNDKYKREALAQSSPQVQLEYGHDPSEGVKSTIFININPSDELEANEVNARVIPVVDGINKRDTVDDVYEPAYFSSDLTVDAPNSFDKMKAGREQIAVQYHDKFDWMPYTANVDIDKSNRQGKRVLPSQKLNKKNALLNYFSSIPEELKFVVVAPTPSNWFSEENRIEDRSDSLVENPLRNEILDSDTEFSFNNNVYATQEELPMAESRIDSDFRPSALLSETISIGDSSKAPISDSQESPVVIDDPIPRSDVTEEWLYDQVLESLNSIYDSDGFKTSQNTENHNSFSDNHQVNRNS